MQTYAHRSQGKSHFPLPATRAKSALHRNLQESLHKRLGCFVEHRFPSIGRIADLYSEEKRLVIEIQTSPITADELLARTRDYRGLGLHIIWIFSDRRFNRYQLTPVEAALEKIPHYFTDGRLFYDQVYEECSGRRRRRSKKLPLNPAKVRIKEGRVSFAGDRFDHPRLALTAVSRPPRWPLSSLMKSWWERRLRSLCRGKNA